MSKVKITDYLAKSTQLQAKPVVYRSGIFPASVANMVDSITGIVLADYADRDYSLVFSGDMTVLDDYNKIHSAVSSIVSEYVGYKANYISMLVSSWLEMVNSKSTTNTNTGTIKDEGDHDKTISETKNSTETRNLSGGNMSTTTVEGVDEISPISAGATFTIDTPSSKNKNSSSSTSNSSDTGTVKNEAINGGSDKGTDNNLRTLNTTTTVTEISPETEIEIRKFIMKFPTVYSTISQGVRLVVEEYTKLW